MIIIIFIIIIVTLLMLLLFTLEFMEYCFNKNLQS